MKLLVDNQIFLMQKFGGISRYFYEILSRMPSDIEVINSTIFSENIYLRHKSSKAGSTLSLPQFRGKSRIYNYVNGFNRSRLLKSGKYDLFHPSYYDPYFLNKLRKPYVITVHDMTYERLPELFGVNDPVISQKRETICSAEKIIAISENTKRDIIDIYGIEDSRIEVIYHGHSMNPEGTEPVAGVPEHYILYVGSRWHYKNFHNFIKAAAIVREKYPEVKVVCTGTKFSDSEQQFINRSIGGGNALCFSMLTNCQLAWIYKNALSFVFPSLYEGFGFPILEAFAMQCPVVLSYASCFPEIAGNAAVYFNPYDIDDMAHTIMEVISDSNLRETLIKSGTARVADFSWEKTAQQTAALYKSMI